MPQPKLTPGTLYIDREQDVLTQEWGPYIKIGIVRNDKDAIERNKEHQTGNPKEIKLVYSINSPLVEDLETQLHHNFAKDRILGEWFLIDDEKMNKLVIPKAEYIVKEQNKYLNYFEARAKRKLEISSGTIRQPSSNEIKLHSKVIEAKKNLDLINAKQDVLKNKIISFSLGHGGIDGILELQTRCIKSSIRKVDLKKDYPHIYIKYENSDSETLKGSINIKGKLTLKKIDSELYLQKKSTEEDAKLTDDPHTKKILQRDESMIILHNEYLSNLALLSDTQWQYESLLVELLDSLGVDDEIEGLISWKRELKKESKFDAKRFKAENPDLFNEYLSKEKYYIATIILPSKPYR